jgi:hypothetical protein
VLWITKYYNEVFAYYKKPGFDNAYNAMKVLKPKLSEFDFTFTCGHDTYGLDEPDHDLATQELYHGDENCVYVDGKAYTFKLPDETRVKKIIIEIKPITNPDILSAIISTTKNMIASYF